jgi:NAD(P)-dependent dehydrogenase (short-subunit alcohol dehydrogenase family)
MSESKAFSGRLALVTGASRGIGAATARMAAKRGYAVCVNYLRNVDAADKIVADIRAAGGSAISIQADVSRDAEVTRLFAELDRQLGTINVLVNNAGIINGQCRADAMTEARLSEIFAANVFSTFYCAREALKRMSTRHGGQGGAIVNVSSIGAKLGSPGDYVDYAASKGAIDTFTVGLAKEVAAEGIRVNAVRPGVIRTEIHAVSGDPSRVERIGAAAPMGRPGEPEEVARAILWLASEEASYMTGAIVDVSGGR